MELNAVEKYRSGRKKQAGASLAARSNHTKTARVVPAGAGNTPLCRWCAVMPMMFRLITQHNKRVHDPHHIHSAGLGTPPLFASDTASSPIFNFNFKTMSS